ncbi:ABC transporter C-terminal domain-containing protein [Akkermansiaceae bacterium]|nr:ABC transporter C-terminal domain-containing protein [Akkermansiaceae bacterium]
MFAGNLTYYLDKTEEDEKVAKGRTSSAPSQSVKPAAAKGPQLSSKERRKKEAAIREKRNKVLKPLQNEFESVEKQIADLEGAQTTISAHLEKPEISGDAEELRKATNAYEQASKKLEMAYSKWETLSDQIEKLQAELAN